jgi:predicted anti-sigma-YlaC factor YlaD
MDCATVREAISAAIDGEDPGADVGVVDEHLAGCADCRRWQDAAHAITRQVRVRAAEPVPPRSWEAAAVGQALSGGPWQGRMLMLARLALVAVAAGQLVLTVPCLILGYDHSAPEHVAHEMGAFDAALAAGFLVAAWRPSRALGMRALVGVASVLLVLTAVIDMVADRTSAADEAPHLLAFAGWLLICYLAARAPAPTAAERSAGGAVLRSWRVLTARPARQPSAGGSGLAAGPAADDVTTQPRHAA